MPQSSGQNKFTEEQQKLREQVQKKNGKSPEELYEERERRVRDAIALKQPDRVPVDVRMTYFPAKHTGIPISTAYYDAAGWRQAVIRTLLDFEPDLWMCASGNSSGKVMEALQPTQTMWPGGPLPSNVSHQAVDVECMREDEYGLFLSDPGDYTVRYLLPRAYKSLEPLADLPSLSDRLIGFAAMTPMFTRDDFRKLARALLKAGEEQEKWQRAAGNLEEEAAILGLPPHGHMGGAGGAPFDIISDFYRGMRGAMLDMFRHPEEIVAACDKLLEWRVDRALPADPKRRGNPKRVFIALHRGAEGFMSKKQFEKFYWPGLKKAMMKTIELGFVPMPFCEGAYGDRLEYFLEMPKGKVVCHFDLTDMFKAKEVLKDHVCIMGNVPSSVLQVGTPSDVDEYCKKLIKVCGRGGGFILTNGSSIDEAKSENIHAMVEAAKKYNP